MNCSWREILWSIMAIILVSGLTIRSPAAIAQTSLTDLGAVAPGLGVNNNGQVVLLQYLYSGGALVQFPANFVGAGINSLGQVVGSMGGSGCANVGLDAGGGCAFGTYASGVLTTYPIFDAALDPAVGNQAQSMNASGEIVGDWTFTHGLGYPLVLTNGVYSALQFPGSTCSGNVATDAGVAYAINDAGQIAGMLPYDQNPITNCLPHAFLYTNGAYSDIGPGFAYALNASGQVTGTSYTVGGSPFYDVTSSAAFLFSNGLTTNLGTLPGDTTSSAYGINAHGLTVGASQFSSSSPPYTSVNRAFFYNGVMNDLNIFVAAGDPLKPFVTLTDARGINDSGLVVINGLDSRDNSKHAYLMQVPLIQVVPGPLTFSSQAINTTSSPQTVTLTNVGTTTLVLGSASATSGFNTSTNNCANLSLAPGAGCAISVTYTPTVAGNPVGGLTILAAGAPIVVPLSGTSPLSASFTASVTTATAGTPVTLTWTASVGSACLATGGSAADGWTGSLASSGSKAVIETTAGTYNYHLSCTAGTQTQESIVSVIVTWPVVTVSLTASPTTVTAGNPTTLTWNSTNADSCVASGGGPNDGWPSGRATNGSVGVTEPFALQSPWVTLKFTMTCTSKSSKQSAIASVQVTEQQAPQPKSGGGGAIGVGTLLSLFGMLQFTSLRRKRERENARNI